MIRPFLKEDIPEVARLRSRFSPEPLQTLVQEANGFFTNPCYCTDIRSLVYVEDGRIVGFVGVLPRSFQFDSSPLTLATLTQVIVNPEFQGNGIGSRLLREVINGPQAVTFADFANDDLRRVWIRIGGRVAPALSINAFVPLKPLSFLVDRLSGRKMGTRIAGSMASAVDTLAARLWTRFLQGVDHTTAEPLSPETLVEHLPRLTAQYRLRPAYDLRQAEWSLGALAAHHFWGDLRGCAVRGTDGTISGWYLYYTRPNGISRLLNLVARDNDCENILMHFLSATARDDSIGVVARPTPNLFRTFSRCKAVFRPGDWFLFHARDAEINAAMLGSEALVTQLEGELAV